MDTFKLTLYFNYSNENDIFAYKFPEEISNLFRKYEKIVLENNFGGQTLVDRGYLEANHPIYVYLSRKSSKLEIYPENNWIKGKAEQDFQTTITAFCYKKLSAIDFTAYAPRSLELFDQNDDDGQVEEKNGINQKYHKVLAIQLSNTGDNGIDIIFQDKFTIPAKASIKLNMCFSKKCDYIHSPHLFLLRSRFVLQGLIMDDLTIINNTDQEIELGSRFIQINLSFIDITDISHLMDVLIGSSKIEKIIKKERIKTEKKPLNVCHTYYTEVFKQILVI